ncbi:hypothetical protein BFL35_10170 [Clavibacter michiganensis]|nr:hypothetical protein BFL35_10170 [Clavibacter michiganensis]
MPDPSPPDGVDRVSATLPVRATDSMPWAAATAAPDQSSAWSCGTMTESSKDCWSPDT